MLNEIVFVRIFCDICVWYLIKAYVIQIFIYGLQYCYPNHQYSGPDGVKSKFLELIKKGNPSRVENLSRLLRSQVYCSIASICGIYVLVTEYHYWPMDLLHHWSSNNQYLFEVAISHWAFSIIEDRAADIEVISHMMVHPHEKFLVFGSFLNGLYSHHVFTIFAYVWSLYSHYLSALCVFGLCFEIPILLMNTRDICVCFEFELLYPFSPTNRNRVITLWTWMSFLWHATRTSFCMLWPISLVFWRRQLVTVPIVSRLVYHLLGVVFNFVNLTIPHVFLRRYIFDDQERIGMISTEMRLQKLKEYGINFTDNLSEDESLTIDIAEPQQSKHENAELNLDTRILGIQDVQAHNTPDDAWIVIESDVYDITSFISKHPGGREILLDYLGQDASKGFLSVGHSLKARKMLGALKIGRLLNHSYSQSNQMRDSSHVYVGDINKPYEVGRTYYSMSDPMAFSFFFPFFWIFFASSLCRELIYSSLKRLSVSYSTGDTALVKVLDPTYIPFMSVDRMEVFHVEGSFTELFKVSVMNITVLLFCAIFWACFLNSFSAHLRNILEFFPSWIGVGYSFNYSQIASSLTSIRSHILALLLVISLSLEWMIFSCGIYSSHRHLIGLRATRISLLFTFAVELMVRKLFFVSSLRGVHSPFPETFQNIFYNHASYVSIFVSLAIELYRLLSASNKYFEKDLLHLFSTSTKAENIYPELPALLGVIICSALLKSLLSRSLSWLSPSNSPTSSSSSESYHSFLVVLLLASIYGFVINILFAGNENQIYHKASVFEIYHALFGNISSGGEFSILLLLLFVSFCLTLFLLSFLVFIRWSTCHYATQVMCLLPALFLWPFAPPMGGFLFQTTCIILLFIGLYCVSLEGQFTLTASALHAAQTNTPINCPHWIHSAKQLENFIRHIFAFSIHAIITRRLVDLSSMIAPDSQKYWASPWPVMDLGPDCDYGMAYQISGKPQKKPGVFQCNIGYIAEPSQSDFFATAGSTLKMMKSLVDDPEAGNNGFVSDIVAQFNLEESSYGYQLGRYSIREVNLNVWENEESAMAWYNKNSSHKDVVKMYYNGGLTSFSAMIASLPVTTQRPIRWDVRCRNCRLMVQGPDPKICPYCQEKILPMPYV